MVCREELVSGTLTISPLHKVFYMIKSRSHSMIKMSTTMAARGNVISPTAIPTLEVYARCGIPLASTLLRQLRPDEQETLTTTVVTPRGSIAAEMHPTLEQRYRTTDGAVRHFLRHRAIATVLEVASGMSPRGLAIVRDFPASLIETDIPKDFPNHKSGLCEKVKLIEGIETLGSHHFLGLNAVTMEGFPEVSQLLPHDEPIILTNEGLISYLTKQDRDTYISNLKGIMASRPGSVWITADFSPMIEQFYSDIIQISPGYAVQHAALKASFMEKLGIDLGEINFPGEQEALFFCERHGFKVTKMGGQELGFSPVSGNLLPPDKRKKLLDVIERAITAWVLELRP